MPGAPGAVAAVEDDLAHQPPLLEEEDVQEALHQTHVMPHVQEQSMPQAIMVDVFDHGESLLCICVCRVSCGVCVVCSV